MQTINGTTYYTMADLRQRARDAIRYETRAAGLKARYLDHRLEVIGEPDGHDRVVLVARGIRPDGFAFEVREVL